MRLTRKNLRDLASLALFIAAVAVSLNINYLLAGPLGTDVPLAVVSSWSMEPTLHVGDLIVVRAKGDYGVGDIIVYVGMGAGRLIVHRIVRVEDGRYVTKGDANRVPDALPVSKSQVKGKVLFVIPYLGNIKLLFEKLIGR